MTSFEELLTDAESSPQHNVVKLSPLGILKRFAIHHIDGRCMDVGGIEDLTGLKLTYSRFVSKSQYYSKRPRVSYIRTHMGLNAGKYALGG
ncbi:uncharacterized protein METZ01_LOCUS296560 [marine metagenome]|uniref:Uncharacterized protein n=1 Tax=marine metagenome TaxID=408172 RepID=A0A382M4B7_9ZZZZ